jgi:hypothetical protein
VLGMFVGVGVIVSVVKMRGHGRSGESLLPEFLRLSAGIQGVIQSNKVHRMRDAITCAFHES